MNARLSQIIREEEEEEDNGDGDNTVSLGLKQADSILANVMKKKRSHPLLSQDDLSHFSADLTVVEHVYTPEWISSILSSFTSTSPAQSSEMLLLECLSA